jgi:hypothetical protein
MKFLVIIMPLILALTASAQPGPDTLWTRFYGWTGDDTAFSIRQTADGGFIIAGTATVPQTGYTDAFLVKADGNGIMQGWHTYGGPLDEGAYSVAVTYDGGYAFSGYTTDCPGPVGVYFVRTNSMGDTICTWITWATDTLNYAWSTSVAEWFDHSVLCPAIVADPTYGGFAADMPRFPTVSCADIWDMPNLYGFNLKTHNLHVMSNGGFALVGRCSVSESDPIQAFLWRPLADGGTPHTYGGNGYTDDAYDFVETASGFVLAGASNDGQTDGIFVCKIDAELNPEWTHRFITPLDQWAEAMVPAMGGGYVLAGTMVTYWGDTDMLLVKVNEDGYIVWQQLYGTDADERAYDMVQTDDGGFVLVGYSTAHVGVMAEWYIVKTLPDPDLAAPDVGNPLPHQYSLSAYPNPFNPTTALLFSLPQSNRVDLSVYDMSGRLVRHLLSDQAYPPGEHRFTFDGSNLPSGIYLARVQAGEFVKTQKLLLLK